MRKSKELGRKLLKLTEVIPMKNRVVTRILQLTNLHGSDIEDEDEELVASEVGEEEETLPFVVRTRYGPPGQISKVNLAPSSEICPP